MRRLRSAGQRRIFSARAEARDDPGRSLQRDDNGHSLGVRHYREPHLRSAHDILPGHAGPAERRSAAVAVREVGSIIEVESAACIASHANREARKLEYRSNKLTSEDLLKGNWRFAFFEDSVLCESVSFEGDGSLTGLGPGKGDKWGFNEEGILFVSQDNGHVTITFNDVFVFAEEAFAIGEFRQDNGSRPIKTWLQRMTVAYSFLDRWTAYQFRDQMDKLGWEIGAYTYGVPLVIDDRMAKLKIGRYGSIATGVSIALGHHRMDTVSTYPFETLKNLIWDWPGAPDVPDHGSNGDVIIGSDVWIASGVFIASGVRIGHGAVIAAHSVVTKDVDDYAIVGGNTAKLIRYRFDKSTISRLLNLRWWDWPADKVNRFLPLMICNDIEAFLLAAETGDATSL